MSIPSGSTYANILNGYFGDHSAEEQNILWLKFLEQHKATADNPPPVSAFVAYLVTGSFKTKNNTYVSAEDVKEDNGVYTLKTTGEIVTHVDSVYASEQSDQALETKLIWSICDILLLLISKLVKTQINTQAAVSFLTEYQKAYQDEMSRVFFYSAGNPVTANSDTAVILSSDAMRTPTVATPSNIDTWNLGYAGITVAECANWLYTKVAEAPAGSAAQGITIPAKMFKWSQSPWGESVRYYEKTGSITIACTRDSNNTFTLAISGSTLYQKYYLAPTYDGRGGTTRAIEVSVPSYYWASSTASVPTDESYGSFKSTFQTLLQNAYTACKAADALHAAPATGSSFGNDISVDPNFELFFPWQSGIMFNYTGVNEKAKASYNKSVTDRGSMNRSMQNYIDAIKTKKDILGDKREQIVNMSETLVSGRKQISNILQTIVRQLQTIMGSIYK
jgi:hypothetical protein